MKGITNNAAQMLKKVLEADRVSAGKCIRYLGSAHGGEFEVDTEGPGDRVFEYEGRAVLVVGPETVEGCREQVLGYEKGNFCLFGDRRRKGYRQSLVADLTHA